MIQAIVYLCIFGPMLLGLLCFAFPQSTWLAADKQRWWWATWLLFPIAGFFMTIPFLLGPLPALLNSGNKLAAHPSRRPSSGGTIFSDD